MRRKSPSWLACTSDFTLPVAALAGVLIWERFVHPRIRADRELGRQAVEDLLRKRTY